MLYGVLPNEHEGVWQAVAMAAADITKTTQAPVGATARQRLGQRQRLDQRQADLGLGHLLVPLTNDFAAASWRLPRRR